MPSLIQNLQCDEFTSSYNFGPEWSRIEFYVSGILHRIHKVHRSQILTTPDGEFYCYRRMFREIVSREEV